MAMRVRRSAAADEAPPAPPPPADRRQQAFEALRALGLAPGNALEEMRRLGVLSATEAGYLTRPYLEWERMLRAGSTTGAYIAALTADRTLAGRTLGDWCMFRPEERTWLEALADGSATTPDITADEAREILAVEAESRAEQEVGGDPGYEIRSRRTEDPLRYWWRQSSFYRFLVGE